MAGRKSFIEIGWKLDTSNLEKADKMTDKFGSRWDKTNREVDKTGKSFNQFGRNASQSTEQVGKLGQKVQETQKHSLKLRDVMKGTFAGVATFGGINMVTNGLKRLYSEMDENAKAWSTFDGNMKQAGKSAGEIKKVKAELQDYAIKTIYNASDMASTYSQLAAVGTKNTTQLVKGFGGLAASAKDPAQAMKTLSTQATQMAARPKVQWEDFKLMLDQTPAGVAAIAKTMHMNTKQLVSDVQDGKVKTQDMFNAITKAGNNRMFTLMATKFKTIGQAADGLWESMAITAQPAFMKLSKVGIEAFSAINDSLNGVDGEKAAKRLDPFVHKAEGFIKYMKANSSSVGAIFKSIGSIGGSLASGAWTAISSMINILAGKGLKAGNTIKDLADSLDSIAKHKTAIKVIGGTFATMFVATKALAFASALREVATGIGLVKAAEVGGTGGKLGGLASGSWLLGGFKGTRARAIETEVAPAVGSRLARYSTKGKLATLGKGALGKLSASKLGTAFKGVKAIGSKIPYIDVALAGTSLIGMNKKNAGGKIGEFGGTLAGMEGGALAGSFLGPVGTLVGGAVGAVGGSKLGKGIGKSIQGAWPDIKKSIGGLFTKMGKGISNAGKGMGKWFNKLGKGFSKNIATPILKAGKGIAKKIAYPYVTAVGLISMAWDKAKKPLLKFKSWIGKNLNKLGKTISKGWNKAIKPITKLWNKAWGGLKKGWSGFTSWIGKKWASFAGTVGKAWSKITTPIKRVWSSMTRSIKSVWSGVASWLGNAWNSLTSVASSVFNSVKDAITKPIISAWNIIKGIFDSISNAVSGITSTVSNVVDSVGGFFNRAHKRGTQVIKGKASGGPISRNMNAITGEAGTELAYNASRGTFRVLGGNGPALTKLFAGEHVLNAKDTSKVLSGGLGAGKVLKGYADGTGNVTKAPVDGGGVASKLSTKAIEKVPKTYDKAGKKSTKALDSLNKKSKKTWSKTQKDTKKSTQKIQTNTVKDFDQMQKGSVVQMQQMHKGMNAVANAMVSDFYKIMSKLSLYAHKAMAGAIRQLNSGISGINVVLNKFGGGGSVLPMIHYAQGSKGPISQHQMAIVNDATDGPHQEAIVKANGQAFIPKGHNVVMPLEPGDEVINGSDTRKLQYAGMLPHYKKGTGGDKGKGMSALADLINNNAKNSNKAFTNDFDSKVHDGYNSKLGGAVLGMAHKASQNQGRKWYGTAWDVLKDAMSLSDGSGPGGSWLHSPGAGWVKTNGFGAGRSFGSHDGVDFGASLGTPFRAMHGGLVTRIGNPLWAPGALGKIIEVHSDDGWQQIYQEFGHMNNIKVSKGDIVKTGQIIGTLGPLVGAGSGPHLHVGVSHGSLWNHGGSSTRGWYDITKMKSTSDGSSTLKPKKQKADSALTKLVKSQLKSQIKWVSKNLATDDAELGDVGGANNPNGAGVTRWIPYIKKAAKAMHVELRSGEIGRILNSIRHESGGNPTVWQGVQDVNSGKDPARGLLQFISSTFRAYAVKGHTNRTSGYDQLLAMFNDKNWRSDLQWNGGWSPSGGRRFATGGNPPLGQKVLVGENGPELVEFNSPATVRSHDKTKQLLKGNKINGNKAVHNNITLNVNVKADSGDGKQIGGDVSKKIVETLTNLFNNERYNLAEE